MSIKMLQIQSVMFDHWHTSTVEPRKKYQDNLNILVIIKLVNDQLSLMFKLYEIMNVLEISRFKCQKSSTLAGVGIYLILRHMEHWK